MDDALQARAESLQQIARMCPGSDHRSPRLPKDLPAPCPGDSNPRLSRTTAPISSKVSISRCAQAWTGRCGGSVRHSIPIRAGHGMSATARTLSGRTDSLEWPSAAPDALSPKDTSPRAGSSLSAARTFVAVSLCNTIARYVKRRNNGFPGAGANALCAAANSHDGFLQCYVRGLVSGTAAGNVEGGCGGEGAFLAGKPADQRGAFLAHRPAAPWECASAYSRSGSWATAQDGAFEGGRVMQLTRMPLVASSLPSDLVKPITPALDAE